MASKLLVGHRQDNLVRGSLRVFDIYGNPVVTSSNGGIVTRGKVSASKTGLRDVLIPGESLSDGVSTCSTSSFGDHWTSERKCSGGGRSYLSGKSCGVFGRICFGDSDSNSGMMAIKRSFSLESLLLYTYCLNLMYS